MNIVLLYERNINKLKIVKMFPEKTLRRLDLLLTVDYPEDPILFRKVMSNLKFDIGKHNIFEIIKFLNENPHFKSSVSQFVEDDLSNMYP